MRPDFQYRTEHVTEECFTAIRKYAQREYRQHRKDDSMKEYENKRRMIFNKYEDTEFKKLLEITG
jgi:hypothetical protein